MPYLEDEDIRRLTQLHDNAEFELNLCGLGLSHSIANIKRMIERSRFLPPKSVIIRIDKATENSGETQFQPIGRYLLEAIKVGTVTKCRPISDAGGGFWIALSGRSNVSIDK